MKHEHTLEVKVPAQLHETVERTRAHLQVNKKSYLFGLGGVVLGVAGTRIFSRPTVTQIVVVQAATSATTD